MGRAISKGKEAKSKMKQLSDMPTPGFEHGSNSGLLFTGTLALKVMITWQVNSLTKCVDRATMEHPS